MISYRSRTEIFFQYRRSYNSGATKPAEHEINQDYVAVDVEDPEQQDNWLIWLGKLGRVRRYIYDVEERVNGLEETLLQEQWPKIHFQIDSATSQQVTKDEQDFLQASAKLKEMFSSAQRMVFLLTAGKGSTDGPQARQVRKNAQVSMNARLNEVASKFRAFQSAYITRMEQNNEFISKRVSKAPTATSPTTIILPYLDHEVPASTQHQTHQEPEARHHVSEHRLLEERSAAIFKIADSVLEVQQCMQHMQTLTIEQGSMLDRIDQNMERADMFLARAKDHIVEAAATQEVALHRKLVLLTLIILIIITMLAIMFK